MSLQSLYNLLKGEIKGLTDKALDAERVMSALRENNVHVEIEEFMRQHQHLEFLHAQTTTQIS